MLSYEVLYWELAHWGWCCWYTTSWVVFCLFLLWAQVQWASIGCFFIFDWDLIHPMAFIIIPLIQILLHGFLHRKQPKNVLQRQLLTIPSPMPNNVQIHPIRQQPALKNKKNRIRPKWVNSVMFIEYKNRWYEIWYGYRTIYKSKS